MPLLTSINNHIVDISITLTPSQCNHYVQKLLKLDRLGLHTLEVLHDKIMRGSDIESKMHHSLSLAQLDMFDKVQEIMNEAEQMMESGVKLGFNQIKEMLGAH